LLGLMSLTSLRRFLWFALDQRFRKWGNKKRGIGERERRLVLKRERREKWVTVVNIDKF